MTAHTVEVVDSLSLLSLKVASNVFDLSSGLHHISIRDQIVRAELAVRDLKRGDSNLESLLVVGAGPAGIAAALEAVERGVAQVVVVEAGSAPFGLLRGATHRFVGPFMYEWPSSFSQNQSYPEHGKCPWARRAKSQLQWHAQDPIAASRLAVQLELHLKDRIAELIKNGKSPPIICVGVNRGCIQDFVREFARSEAARALSRLQRRAPGPSLQFSDRTGLAWPRLSPAQVICRPRYVLLAAGMGAENVTLVNENLSGGAYHGPNVNGPRFWNNDRLMSAGAQDLQVSIFGGGDGALQDVLRALTRRNHPLELLASLERDPKTKAALRRISPALLDADRQSRQFGAWTQKNDEYATIDAVCLRLAKELAGQSRVARKVSQLIAFGRGKVTLFVRGRNFGKAYLLNRFLVHLIWACKQSHPTMWAKRMDFEVRFRQSAVAYSKGGNGQHVVTIKKCETEPPTSYAHECQMIAVRYGIEPGRVPGAQMIQVSQKPSRQRTTLARIELPFVAE